MDDATRLTRRACACKTITQYAGVGRPTGDDVLDPTVGLEAHAVPMTRDGQRES